MRKNEYNSLEEFKNQYTGEWNPSEGHWLGLDFMYGKNEYRLSTGSMYTDENTILPDGREAIFYLYIKDNAVDHSSDYALLGEFATINDLLDSTIIGGIKFSEVIMADETVLLGQD